MMEGSSSVGLWRTKKGSPSNGGAILESCGEWRAETEVWAREKSEVVPKRKDEESVA